MYIRRRNASFLAYIVTAYVLVVGSTGKPELKVDYPEPGNFSFVFFTCKAVFGDAPSASVEFLENGKNRVLQVSVKEKGSDFILTPEKDGNFSCTRSILPDGKFNSTRSIVSSLTQLAGNLLL